jgi:hypothetical protein
MPRHGVVYALLIYPGGSANMETDLISRSSYNRIGLYESVLIQTLFLMSALGWRAAHMTCSPKLMVSPDTQAK